MDMQTYDMLSPAEAEAALEEFVAERAPALRMLQDQVGSDVVLDRTVESLVPLWRWMTPRLTKASGEHDTGRRPTWSRYGLGSSEVLSDECLPLVDGLVSYVARVVQTRFPQVGWVLDTDPHPRYLDQNKPALAWASWRVAAADVVSNACRRWLLKGTQDDERLANAVRFWLTSLTDAEGQPAAESGDELFEVVDLRAEDGDRHSRRNPDFEIGLDDSLAGTHPKLLATLRKALSTEPGVVKVVEEDREVLLVHAPDWDEQRLTDWVNQQVPRPD